MFDSQSGLKETNERGAYSLNLTILDVITFVFIICLLIMFKLYVEHNYSHSNTTLVKAN